MSNQNVQGKNDELSNNQMLVYAAAIFGACFALFFITKCTSSVMSTPDITQALQTCQVVANYTVNVTGDDKRDPSNFVPSPSPELFKSVEQCREQVKEIYIKKGSTGPVPLSNLLNPVDTTQ